MKKSIKKTWRSLKKPLNSFSQAKPLPLPCHLILFDGYCNLCHSMVRFVLKKDKKRIFVFAPLQGPTSKKVFKDFPKLYTQLDSFILLENYQTEDPLVWMKAKGVLRVSGLLGGWYHLFSWMAYLPGFLVNPFYNFVAKRRFRLFGTSSSLLPDPKYKKRFLE